MKIAYAATSRLPSTEANGVHVMRMAAALSSLGHEVRLYAKPGCAALGEPHAYYGTHGFDVVAIPDPPIRGLRPWLRGARIGRAVRAWGADVTFGRDPHAILAVARAGRPVGYEMHQLSEGRRADVEQRLFALDAARLFVFISQGLERDYLAHHPSLRGRERLVIPDGADVPPAPTRSATDRLTVAYVGQTYAGRGLDLIAELARRMPELRFRIVGGTPEGLAELLGPGQVPANIEHVPHVPPARVPDELALCDIALAPYQTGLRTARGGDTSAWMSPLKIFEYMASALPIIASDLPVLREVLRPGENALLVGPTDVDGWAEAVQRLRDSPELRARLGAAARADLVERHSWHKRAEQILTRLAPS